MQRDRDVHRIIEVDSVHDETPTVRTLSFADAQLAAARPGEFCMVWVPGVAELPMSIMASEEPGRAAFTVRRHGAASTALFGTGKGKKIGIRGPYGNSFDVHSGRIMLVGGGTGMVPLMRLITFLKKGDRITVISGAKTKDEVFFEEKAAALAGEKECEFIACTEDGTYGRPGLPTAAAKEMLASGYDAVYTCGPEMMMHGVVKDARESGTFVQASIERVMKCGIGVCGSCCMGESLVCRDGTVFGGDRLASNPDFGRAYRSKSGEPVTYPK